MLWERVARGAKDAGPAGSGATALRICPARLHAERRLRGEPGPDPEGLRIERLIASLLGIGGGR